ncbi:alpha/beta hydrolase fold domain-containing protein [Paenibacillus sabinae]|uniref:Coagulation factor 5/8 type domain-containing protein n=1 Tax=Paenibacillus sabinae T27 TaxID=1268072 RepID=X4ZG31_9BACL|nr:alpha/beta hydrolase fold domain-containing protein [Paenibacillus sabinae]AHV98491.1 coagulation factor 5/8 type domain-containing protein [Paenibacillus sabinae T27]
MSNGLRRKAYRLGTSVLLALVLLCPPFELQALTSIYAAEPSGDNVTLYEENFDDPDNFGSVGGVPIPAPWLQEGEENSVAKTSVSSTAPSTPNLVKIDGKDALALPVNTTGYGNLQLSYYTRASSYIGGSIIVEWSGDGGSTWTTLEEFKLPPGTLEQKNSEPNKLKVQFLGSGADNNPNVKVRFRVGELMSANMYIDSVAIKAQAIPGIPPAETPVPIPPPVEPQPFPVPEGVELYEDVLIGNAGTRSIYTSIAVPKTLPHAPMPVMVYIHGGGWNHGDRKQALANICNYVTKRGYIGVSLDYRLTPEAPFPAQLQDVKLAIRYLRAHAAEYHLDPSRIGVWGSSAGGHLASLLGTTGHMDSGETTALDTGHVVNVPDLDGTGGWQEYSDQVQAVVDMYGPADFTTKFANSYSSVTALLGGNNAFSVPDQARLAMPGTYASPDDPPFFIRHGDADATIPYTDSVTFSNQLKDAGVKVIDVKIVPGQGHGFTGGAAEQANAEAWAFLDQYVKNRTAAKPTVHEPDASNDHVPPSWPDDSSLKTVNIGTDFIKLAWPAAMDNQGIGEYRVYQDDELLSTVTGVTYTVTGLHPGTAYAFKVKAVDLSGNTSAPLSFIRSTLTEPIVPYATVNVTASDSDGNIATNTIDNNLFTRWSAAGNGAWIQYDLGERKPIGYLGVAFYKGDLRTTQFVIETSDDGVMWTPGWSGASSGRTTEMQPFDLPDTEARYVRIIGLGNSDGSAYTSLSEVNIYAPFANGDTPVASIPNYTPGPAREPVPFTAPGLTEADGTVHPVHSPHATSGRILNVLNFNADPADNDTDDGAAIQAAINSAQPGDEVYLPCGVYNLNSTLDTLVSLKLKSGVNLRGENQSQTILKTSLDKVRNSALMKASGQHDLSISNLTLTSTWNGVYTTDHKVNNPDAGGPDSMIVIANLGEIPSYNITVDQVTVEKYSRMGVRIDNSRDIVVRRSTFRNATDVGPGGAGYGVSIQGMAKQDRNGYDNDTLWNVVEDSRFEGPYLRHGVLIQFVAHNNTLRNNQFVNTKLDAIDLHGELEYLNEIYGNVISDIPAGAAIGLGNTGGTAPSNHSKTGPRNYIHDNTISNTREGINVIMGTPDTVIEHNLIEYTTHIEDAKGIRILNGPGTIIKENVIRYNTASNYWAISLEHDPGDSKADNIGEGDPLNVQLIGNSLTGNTNGIRLLAGSGIVLQGNLVDSIGVNYFKSEQVEGVEGWPSDSADAID